MAKGPCVRCGVADRNSSGKCRPCLAKSGAAHYRANVEKKRARSKVWFQANKDAQRQRTKAWREKNPERYLLSQARSRAKRSGVPFDLTLDDVSIPVSCPVLSIPLSRNAKTLGDGSPTIDRMLPHRGYVRGNVTVISARANRIKSDASIDDVKRVLAYMRRALVRRA